VYTHPFGDVDIFLFGTNAAESDTGLFVTHKASDIHLPAIYNTTTSVASADTLKLRRIVASCLTTNMRPVLSRPV